MRRFLPHWSRVGPQHSAIYTERRTAYATRRLPMRHFLSRSLLATGLILAGSTLSQAGHEVPEFRHGPKEIVPREMPFEKGNHEFQALAGAFFSFSPDGSERVDFDIAIASLRLGWMLSTPGGEGFFRGNYEFLLEVFGGPVIDGPGSGVVGATMILRYNFVQPEARVVPYFQVGAGGLYSDGYEDQSQNSLGSAFEFNLQASVGARFFVCPQWAITVEGGYRHISNAGFADRNRGVDSLGGLVGVSYFY